MKKIRIILAAALAVLMIASLAACGGSQGQNAVTEGNDVITEVAEQTDANAERQVDEDAAVSADAENTADDAAPSTDAVAATTPFGVSFGSFKTTDLGGNEIDESIFARKDYTMVNFWGTFCPPCIAEMPDLAELNKQLPDNIQMVGLICDLYYGQEIESVRDQAEAILNDGGATYTNLLIWPEALETINSFTAYVPTTFFVDAEGNIVGEPIIGADINSCKDRIIALSK